jgi:sulfite reductase (ferredoxin)
VRNITAPAMAGIDPEEPFDVSPYAQAVFEYFLRNPVCQEMGRKFKIAFSSSERDTAFAFIHDLGFLPRIRREGGEERRGFRVLIGGGLGAQPFMAQEAFGFLEEEKLIPFTEGVLRVFDRWGERARRHKARLKFLIADLGLAEFLRLVEEERLSLKHQNLWVETRDLAQPLPPTLPSGLPDVPLGREDGFRLWFDTNVFPQKQTGYYAVGLKVPLGNLSTDLARSLAALVRQYAADELRITINQGFLLKFVRPEVLPALFLDLDRLGLAHPGFDSTADITACPGTDTCNLGISNSTGIVAALEKVLIDEYPDLLHNRDIRIKISGCPNSCGQHAMASIGFHGSSIKLGERVMPALQVLLGGSGEGEATIAEKVIKIPSRRGPEALRLLIDDYRAGGLEGEYYADYFRRRGKMYFYAILKPLADLEQAVPEWFIDWGSETGFAVETAVGECAGVIIDLVATLLYDAEEKASWALSAFESGHWADSIYHSYNVFVTTAKALLLREDVRNSNQVAVIRDYDRLLARHHLEQFPEGSFETHVLRINRQAPGEDFAARYLADALAFLDKAMKTRPVSVDSKPVNQAQS